MMKRETLVFEYPGKQNTEELLNYVDDYIKRNMVSMIIISSTTGFTIRKFEEKFKYRLEIPVVICKQDISKEFFMDAQTIKYLEKKYEVYDIPRKYLQTQIGLEATNILRKVCQGFKVCIELVEFLLEQHRLNEGKVLVIAGTLKGADTVVTMNILKCGTYNIDQIVCLPQNGDE